MYTGTYISELAIELSMQLQLFVYIAMQTIHYVHNVMYSSKIIM